MDNYLKTYQAMRRRLKAYQYVQWLIGWDQETEAPKGSVGYRTKQIQVLTEEFYQLVSDPAYMESIEKLYERLDTLEDHDLKVEIKHQFKELRIIKKVPKEEYIAYQVLISSASQIWASAKNKDDFELFAPTLEKIVEFNRKFVKYLETAEMKGYDILLDMY
ncbi:MAG: hypothetical protein IH571_07350, partial [Acholeplasmataceae bacterium]|nr:hypothetical protein [Acholeplasmataceae bacterium]